MTKAFGERRRAAFLSALSETGNQTLSARRAKVSRSWVTLHKSGDPAFAAACAAARARLQGAEETAPPARWGVSGGAELVVRGTNGRRVQVAAARVKQWDPGTEDRFLARLAATCNVKAACQWVGLTPASAYVHRKRRPGFHRRWAAAVEEGYLRLETALVQGADNLLEGEPWPEELEGPGMTIAQAIHVLHMHKNEVRGVGGRPGLKARRRTMDEVRDSIMRKVQMVRRVHGLPPLDAEGG